MRAGARPGIGLTEPRVKSVPQHPPRRRVVPSGQEAADEGPRERLEQTIPTSSRTASVMPVAMHVMVVPPPRRQGRVRGDLLEATELLVRVRAEERGEVAAEAVGREARDVGPSAGTPLLVLAAGLRRNQVVRAGEAGEEIRSTLVGAFSLATKDLCGSVGGDVFSALVSIPSTSLWQCT